MNLLQLSILAIIGSLASTSAWSAFCYVPRTRTTQGQDVNAYMKVTVSTVPRPGNRRRACGVRFSSSGGQLSAKLIIAPKLGKIRLLTRSRLVYRGDKVGKDYFVIQRQSRNSINNQIYTYKMRFEIDVVSSEF